MQLMRLVTISPALVATLLAPQSALAQTQPDRAASSATAEPSSLADQTHPGSGAGADEDPLRVFRGPLLREGSSIVEAAGTLRHDPNQNCWTLNIPATDAGAPPYELVVLPCTRLAEMERILESMPGGATFRVTGRVLVFRNRNYLLPSHTVVVTAASAPDLHSVSAVAADAAASAPAASAPAAAADGDTAESIMRDLEMQSGPVARSSGAGSTRPSASTASRTAREHAITAGPSTPIGPSASRSAGSTSLQENTAIINRRGKVTRDRSGGWMFVFDADSAGLADPPLRLLPCLLLESIEDYARRAGNNSPMIVTGQVYLYDGQGYLLPTVYRIPRESSRITP